MKKIFSALMVVLLGAALQTLPSTPSFIVKPRAEREEPSRNEVKEEVGISLRALVDVGAQVQSSVGKMMMQWAALQRTIASQAEALVTDDEPFSSASTGTLVKAQAAMTAEISELRAILDSLDALTERVSKTVRLSL